MIYDVLDSILYWLWVFLIVGSIYYLVRTARRHNISVAFKGLFSYRLLLPVLVIVTLSLILEGLIFIPPHQIGVVVSVVSENGVRNKPITAGIHWLVPSFEKVVFYPAGLQTYTMSGKALEGHKVGDDSIVARTQDGKEVHVECSVVFKIDSDKVIELHQTWQDRYVEEFVRPAIRSVVRTEISQHTIAEVNSDKRRNLEIAFRDELEKKITRNGLKFDTFFLRNMAFSYEYAQSVEEEHMAQVEAKTEANAIVVRANAEAQAEAVLRGKIAPNPSLVSPECRCQ